MEMGASYRKRFLWQIAESELTAIQVAINRRNLVNPIKSSAPLNRVFDPERHSLIVHLNRKNTLSGSIFNVDGVVCNKEVTPDRSLDRHGQDESSQPVNRDGNKHRRLLKDVSRSDQSSDASEVGSPRIYTKNSNPKCCRDLFLQDELKMKISEKCNSKNRPSKESGCDRSYTNKDIDNKASTSGFHITHNRRSRSVSQSSGSIDFLTNVRHKQSSQNMIESKQMQKSDRYKASKDNYDCDLEERSPTNRTSYSIRHQWSKYRLRKTPASDDDTSQRQKQRSSKQTTSELASAKSKLYYYGNNTDRISRSPALRSTTTNSTTCRSARSKSKANRRMNYQSTRLSRSKSRSLTPLRPGEYRPGKRKRLSSPSISRSSSSGVSGKPQGRRPTTPDQAFSPIDYPAAHISMPFQPAYPPFTGHAPLLPSRAYPNRAPSMFPPPFIQYVPVLAHHSAVRGPSFPPSLYQPTALYHSMRPPKVYNNRPIPHFAAIPQSRRTSVVTPGDASTAHIQEKVSIAADSDPSSTSTSTLTRPFPGASTLDTEPDEQDHHIDTERLNQA